MGKIKITEQQLADLIAMNTIDKPIGKIMTLDKVQERKKAKRKKRDLERIPNPNDWTGEPNPNDIEEGTTTSSAFPAKPKVKEDLESIENSTTELKSGVDALGKALGELNITNNRANIGSNKKIKHSNHQTHMMEDDKEDKYEEGFFDEIETYLSSKKSLDERMKRDWGSARKSMNEDDIDTHTFKKNRMMRRPYSSKYNRKGLNEQVAQCDSPCPKQCGELPIPQSWYDMVDTKGCNFVTNRMNNMQQRIDDMLTDPTNPQGEHCNCQFKRLQCKMNYLKDKKISLGC